MSHIFAVITSVFLLSISHVVYGVDFGARIRVLGYRIVTVCHVKLWGAIIYASPVYPKSASKS